MYAFTCNATVLSAVLLLCMVVSLLACADDKRCEAVCTRPFAMEESYAKQRVQRLQVAPKPWPERAQQAFNRWQKAHNQALKAYLPGCIEACEPDRVLCQESAVNIAEWAACGR